MENLNVAITLINTTRCGVSVRFGPKCSFVLGFQNENL